jgi:hypothetical protein
MNVEECDATAAEQRFSAGTIVIRRKIKPATGAGRRLCQIFIYKLFTTFTGFLEN